MTDRARFPDLDGQSIFITGGGSGIGAALTDGFLAQGAKVAFVQRSNADEFCAEMHKKHGNKPLGLVGDITDTKALQSAIDQAANAHGAISVLVNNAANDARHDTEAVTEGFWDEMIAINLKAYFFACQAVVAGMREKGGGTIINFSSIAYLMGNTGYPTYTTANAGIMGMTRSLAREFGPDNIRVNAVAPGWVMTEKQQRLWVTPEDLASHLARQCLQETIKPEDLVAPVLFLASKASRMMTGQVMPVDGGVVVTG